MGRTPLDLFCSCFDELEKCLFFNPREIKTCQQHVLQAP
jgi:hypothetical protein